MEGNTTGYTPVSSAYPPTVDKEAYQPAAPLPQQPVAHQLPPPAYDPSK